MKKGNIVVFSLILFSLTFILASCSTKTSNKGYVREDVNSYGKVAWQEEVEFKVDIEGTLYNVQEFSSVYDAIEQAISEGGGTVYFPPGTYSIDKPIELDLPKGVNLTLMGEPNAHSILKGERTVEGPVISIQSKGVSLANLVLQSYSNDHPALLVKGDGTRVYKCWFQGMNLRNEESTVIIAASDVVVASCNFSNVHPEAYTLEITKYPDKEVKKVYVVDFFLNGEFNGFVVTSDDENGYPEDVLIQRGVFLNYSKEQLTIKSVKNLTVDNNMLDQSALYCITLSPIHNGIDNVVIKENYIAAAYGLGQTENATAIYVDGTNDSKASNVLIKNNMIAYSMLGVHITGGNFVDSEIRDNVFQSTQSFGLKIEEAKGLSISRNSFKPDNGSIGLEIESQDENTVVENNF